MSQRVAAVDIGTNSVRLLVAERDPGGGLHTLVRPMRITRLGQGVDASGALAEAAISRTLDAVAAFAEVWRDHEVSRVGITATAAARDASNTAVLAAGVQQASGGVPLRVLTGEEEAAYAFAGAVGVVDQATRRQQVAVIDIGGGSTEVIRGADRPGAHTSRQLGSVRLTERLLLGDPPTAEQVARADAEARRELEGAAHAVAPRKARHLVGVAGTVTTLAALALGLERYDPGRIHGAVMTRQDVDGLTAHLVALPASARAALGPMEPGRADVIAGGAIILRAALDVFGFDELVASEADILDGLATELLASS